ncbi:MAG: peptidylprolyl isomerase [Anaerolineae bacterium]|nr:peptidylprolyl isomerase [Anaerolineae bacterium]
MQRHHIFQVNRLMGVLLAILMLATPLSALAQAPIPADAVSVINGDPISREAFHARVRLVRWQYLHELTALYEATGGNFGLTPAYVKNLVTNLQDPSLLGDAVLAEMEEERLLWQTGERLGVTPTAEDAALREANFFSAWTNISVDLLDSSGEARQFIAEWYADAMAYSGLSENDIRLLFETDALHSRLYEYVAASVPTEELAANTRHILCSFHPADPGDTTPPTQAERDAAQTCIQGARIRLANGEDFATVAADLSDDAISAIDGGNVGWSLLSFLTESYADAARDAELNTLIGPVETEFGLHLIEVLDRQMQTLTDSQLEQSQQGYFQLWLEALREEATITRLPGWDGDLPTDPALEAVDPAILEAIAEIQ